MKFDILDIALALYAGELQYLDLDTGEAYAKFCIDQGWEHMPDNARLLPMYSRAYVYQRYLREMLPKTGMEDTIHLEEYPDFPQLLSDDWEELDIEFVSNADHFLRDPVWCEFERQNEAKKINNLPGYDSTFVPYLEFANALKKKIAIEWCVQEGYEWYEPEELLSNND